MGAKDEKRIDTGNGELKGKPVAESGNTDGRTDGNSSSESSRTGNTDTRGNRNGGTGTGNAEKETVVSGLAVLTGADSAPVPEQPKKKQTRKKKPTKKKQEETPAFSSSQISALLVSISGVVATRPNCHMFALSEMEAEQIATPLSNIIAKSEKLSGVSEHADAIALVSACLIIMLPRVMLYFDALKQKKLESNGGVKIADKRNDKKAESGRNSRETVGTSPADKPINVNGVLASIPSIV